MRVGEPRSRDRDHTVAEKTPLQPSRPRCRLFLSFF